MTQELRRNTSGGRYRLITVSLALICLTSHAAPINGGAPRESEGVQFLFNGELRSKQEVTELAGDNLILFADRASASMNLAYAFNGEEDFLRWAKTTEYAEKILRAHEGMLEEQRKYAGLSDAEAYELFKAQAELPIPQMGAGVLYDGPDFAGSFRSLPPTYPHLGWVNFDERTSSVIVLGVTVLCEKTFYRGAKLYLLLGPWGLERFGFDNQVSSVY
jgi:hypothetical protein